MLKKKIVVVSILTILLLALTACPNDDSGSGGSHSHSFSADWSYNGVQHWQECSCGDKMMVGNHSGDPCMICGHDSTHTHAFSEGWSHSAAQHWRECVGCGYKKEAASHRGNPCTVCGYEVHAPYGNYSGMVEGTAMGYGGDVTVVLTLVNGIIVDVMVTGDREPIGYARDVFTTAPHIIVATNSVELDTISGATKTTNAIVAAGRAALAKIP